MAVNPIPEGYTSVTPYLVIKGADKAIDYYKNVFGATEILRMNAPDDTVAHAEIQIGTAKVMLSEECPDMNWHGPTTIGGTPVSLMVYVEDVDKTFQRGINAGGIEIKAVETQFYGDRSGLLQDPFGHMWNIATHVEDLTEEELHKRSQKAMEGMGG